MHILHQTPSAVPAVDVIYAGGTISSQMVDEGFRAGGHAYKLTELLEYHDDPAAERNYQISRQIVAFTGLSENMDSRDWKEIDDAIEDSLARNPTGILLTHGTDSMEQTAAHLVSKFGHKLVQHHTKIIMTGANEDMEHPATDVWENLRYALQEASVSKTAPGVYIAYYQKLIPAKKVAKLPFVSGGKASFISSDDGLYKKALDKQQKLIAKQVTDLQKAFKSKPNESIAVLYDVNVIRDNHEKFVNDVVADPAITSVLLNLYHSGTANTDSAPQSVADLVGALRSTRPNLVFFGVTENGEPVDLHGYETSVKLRKAGVVPLYDMLREVALTKLRLLNPDFTPAERIQAMLKDTVGEIDEARINQADISLLVGLYRTK